MNRTKIHAMFWCALLVAAVAVPGQAANKYVSGLVPNWDQPYDYPDAYDASGPGPDPNPGQPINPWDAWCTPTAAAMMLGHWADVKGSANTGDASADGNQGVAGGYAGAIWPAVSWHDYTADGTNARPAPGGPTPGVGSATDIGWYMNTNNLGDAGLTFRPGVPHVGTFVGNAAEGLNNFLTDRGSALAGNASTTYVNPVVGGIGLPAVLALIKGEIDANRTVLGHFKWWVNPQAGAPGPGQGDGTETGESDFEATGGFSDYDFPSSNPGGGVDDEQWNGEDGEEGLGHTVTIVGYSDDAAGNVTHLIAHDNWPATVRNVRVPVFQGQLPLPLNAVTTLVPEPASLVLLGLGGLALLRRRRRR